MVLWSTGVQPQTAPQAIMITTNRQTDRQTQKGTDHWRQQLMLSIVIWVNDVVKLLKAKKKQTDSSHWFLHVSTC